MLILTEQCDIWRMVQRAGQTVGKLREQVIYQRVKCLVVPISEEDALMPYARESTHTVMLPRWLSGLLQKEDEIRTGRRQTPAGNIVQFRYVVAGIRDYQTFGLRHLEAFVKERE